MTFTTKTQIIGAATDEETGEAIATSTVFPLYAVMETQGGSWYSRPTDIRDEAEDIARTLNERHGDVLACVAVEIRPID